MKAIFFFSAFNRPVEEFSGILNQLGRPYVKFYDTNKQWYMEDRWKEEIQEALDRHGPPDLSIGYSMGGWAALYHQSQICAKRVIAFSPQGTTIPQEVKKVGGKYSKIWATHLESVNGCRMPPPCGNYTIYFGNHTNTGIGESGHKNLLTSLGYNITTVEVPNPSYHNIIGQLHEQGKLVDIIKQHLND
jgi:hypothetical protein